MACCVRMGVLQNGILYRYITHSYNTFFVFNCTSRVRSYTIDSLCPPKVHFNLKVTVRSFQFVPLRNFLGDRFQNNSQASQAHLAKEVLAEIPSQVTLYMKKRGIKPRAPPPAYQTTDAQNSQPASAPMW